MGNNLLDDLAGLNKKPTAAGGANQSTRGQVMLTKSNGGNGFMVMPGSANKPAAPATNPFKKPSDTDGDPFKK